jgi:hypothetical protein
LKDICDVSCEKGVRGITGTDLYVCFSVLATKQRLGVSAVQIYFNNNQVTPRIYFKKRLWYFVLSHTTSNITIRKILPLVLIVNYSVTPTVVLYES